MPLNTELVGGGGGEPYVLATPLLGSTYMYQIQVKVFLSATSLGLRLLALSFSNSCVIL